MGRVARSQVPGPLAPFAEGFRSELDRLGYTPLTREFKVNEMARLSRWLEARGLSAGDLDEGKVNAFSAQARAAGKRSPTEWAMRPLLAWLRDQKVIGALPPAPREAADNLIDEYRQWMVAERALSARTIERYEKGARSFLHWRAGGDRDAVGVEGLDAEAVTGFLLSEASRGLAPESLRDRVAELRSLMKFLYLRGITSTPLGLTVPPVPGWKDARVPPRLSPVEVTALLDSCDRATPTGKRDFAVLLLLARLGLRAAEVTGLALEDLDWRRAEVAVHGKAGRSDRMPLPTDVGEALATYINEARPRSGWRNVFLSAVAPPRPLARNTVSQTVWRQCRRAGLGPFRAHRLRHALACQLLGLGVTLPEIAQVLRQRDLATTASYAKLDYASLRGLALPWPVAR